MVVKVLALEGAPLIHTMIEQARGRIIIVPGGGVSASNLQRILDQTGAREFHSSCRISLNSQMTYLQSGIVMGSSMSMSEFTLKIACPERVRRIKSIGDKCVDHY